MINAIHLILSAVDAVLGLFFLIMAVTSVAQVASYYIGQIGRSRKTDLK